MLGPYDLVEHEIRDNWPGLREFYRKLLIFWKISVCKEEKTGETKLGAIKIKVYVIFNFDYNSGFNIFIHFFWGVIFYYIHLNTKFDIRFISYEKGLLNYTNIFEKNQ